MKLSQSMQNLKHWLLLSIQSCAVTAPGGIRQPASVFKWQEKHTVQLRYMYIRTTHTRIIPAYFAYTRMSIRTRTCVYTRVYVSLLCIPISFFIWSIVGWTRHIIFMEWKRLQSEICILLKRACWWMKAIIFRILITLQSHQQTNVSWTLAWS